MLFSRCITLTITQHREARGQSQTRTCGDSQQLQTVVPMPCARPPAWWPGTDVVWSNSSDGICRAPWFVQCPPSGSFSWSSPHCARHHGRTAATVNTRLGSTGGGASTAYARSGFLGRHHGALAVSSDRPLQQLGDVLVPVAGETSLRSCENAPKHALATSTYSLLSRWFRNPCCAAAESNPAVFPEADNVCVPVGGEQGRG